MHPLLITAILPSLLLLAGIMWMRATVRRQQRELLALRARLDAQAGDIGALCSGAVGLDRRVVLLESQSRRLDLRQETLENRQQDDRPYGEAIQLVQKGASASGLVDKLGLSQSEAELVAMLHGTRRAS